jgi:hypothetical protein
VFVYALAFPGLAIFRDVVQLSSKLANGESIEIFLAEALASSRLSKGLRRFPERSGIRWDDAVRNEACCWSSMSCLIPKKERSRGLRPKSLKPTVAIERAGRRKRRRGIQAVCIGFCMRL